MIRFRSSTGERTFDWTINLFLLVVLVVTIVPLLYVLLTSLTPLGRTPSLLLPPSVWSLEAYRQLLGQPSFLRATLISVAVTLGGVAVNMVLTVLTAYPLSRPSLPGRKLLIAFVLFTFLFNAGLIPTYLVVRDLGLLNTLPSLVLPGAISVYNVFVMKAFFQNLPHSLEEAARLDGANEFQVLWHVVLPLSKPILLAISLFYAVGHWNEFFTPILYLSDSSLMPLPVLLRNILIGANLAEYVEASSVTSAPQEAIKMAAVVLATLPMLLVYPWIQQYFTKGVLLGSVKE